MLQHLSLRMDKGGRKVASLTGGIVNAQHPAVFSHLFHLQHIANGQRDLVGAFSGVRRYATVPGVAKWHVARVRVSSVEY